MRHATKTLKGLGIPCEAHVISAHRTPNRAFEYGVPMQTSSLNGLDSLLSIAQMLAGVSVGTLAIGRSGAI